MKLSLKLAALAAMLAAAGAHAAPPASGDAGPQRVSVNSPAGPQHMPGLHGGPQAGMHRFGRMGMQGTPLVRQLRGLDLSETQRDAIDDIFVKHHKEQRELFKRGRDLRQSFSELSPLAKDYVSQSGKLADQAAKLAHDQIVLRAKVDSEIVATLTPAQAQQLQAKLAERAAKRAAHRHPPAGEEKSG